MNRPSYLLYLGRVTVVPKFNRIKSLFCKHVICIDGESCSERGLIRISGEDRYTICMRCGKILQEKHTQYV